ncbi:ring finger protein [Halenospora varia]|nr:ring finger protein [Halenospora varia]
MQQFSEAPEGNFQVPPPPHPAPPPGFDQPQQQQEQPRPQEESQETCIDTVLVIFPDICRDHVAGLYDKVAHNSDQIIDHILENGGSYPKAKDKQKTLKRKREVVVVDEDAAAAAKYGAADRASPVTKLRAHIKEALSSEFPDTPKVFIDATLTQSNYRLFPAYRVLEEASRTFDPAHPPYNKIKTARKKSPQFLEHLVQVYIDNPTNDAEMKEMMRELQAARKMRKKAEQKHAEERQKEIEEEANYAKAEAEGTLSECGCCFSDYPLNRMIHCNGDTLHWFCRGCARQTAEVEIGNSKYELHCMSMEGCTAGFSNEQRSQFLDEKTIIALERNEQEAMLRMAGIENLESCPFCPFAAEYPPVEVNKEFTCQSPDCEIVSCRLCKLVSHIPKTCEEFAKENGLSVRRQIEEAMSAALIRKCNKCGTPFVKEEGCNKMTCTRNGCFNVQCYVCSKSCGYDHFNDKTRGGKEGNCPLFESVEARHEEEVKKAEKEALEKVRAEHPEYTEEDLMVKVSEDVKKDEQLRKARTDPAARLLQVHG